MWEFLNGAAPAYFVLAVAFAAFPALWAVPLLLGRITRLEKRIDKVDGFATQNKHEVKKWVADNFAFKSIEKMNADTAYAEIERLQNELKELNAYAERNIKRIDDDLSGLDTEVESLDDAVIAVQVDVERMAAPAWKRWLRGLLA